jgi:hypothetical protein
MVYKKTTVINALKNSCESDLINITISVSYEGVDFATRDSLSICNFMVRCNSVITKTPRTPRNDSSDSQKPQRSEVDKDLPDYQVRKQWFKLTGAEVIL